MRSIYNVFASRVKVQKRLKSRSDGFLLGICSVGVCSHRNGQELWQNDLLLKILLLLRNADNHCDIVDSILHDEAKERSEFPVSSSRAGVYNLTIVDVRHIFSACSAGLRHVSSVIGLKWTLRGEENLRKDYTCVFVANHQSALDVQGMLGSYETSDETDS